MKRVNRKYYGLIDIINELKEQDNYSPVAPYESFSAMIADIATASSLTPWTYPTASEAEKSMFKNYLWPQFFSAPVLFEDAESSPWEAPAEPELSEEKVYDLLGRFHRWYIDSTERYSILIGFFEAEKTHLMDGVKVTTAQEGESSSEGSSSGTNTGTVSTSGTTDTETDSTITRTNYTSDVPQSGSITPSNPSYVTGTSGGTEVTDLDTGVTQSQTVTNNLANSATDSQESSYSSNIVMSNDVTTKIERMKELQDKLRNLYGDWANEFSQFIIRSAE